HGMVSTHAHTIVPATPHRTAEAFRAVPTPTIAPVMVCVVDTGMPNAVARNRVAAPPVSAQKPPTGLSFVMRVPIVLTMRQPPESVPKLIAACAQRTTHKGIGGSEEFGPYWSSPPAASTAVMMPIVFCASLPPWPSEKAAAESNWPFRKKRSTLCGDHLRKIQKTATISRNPSNNPMTGDSR